MAYATVADIETETGPIADDQVDRVTTLIERAEAQIEQRVPDLAERITDGRTSQILVIQVVCEMVAGVLRNPEGVSNRYRTVGPFAESLTYAKVGDSTPTGLTLTARQMKLLGLRRGAVTIPNGDPALAHVLRRPHEYWRREDRYGLVWPVDPDQTP